MNVKSLTSTELATAMNGTPLTSQWDMICSYSIPKLNDVLKQQHVRGILPKDITFSQLLQDPSSDRQYTLKFEVRLANPSITFFHADYGHVTLSMPVEKVSYSLTNKDETAPYKQVTIPENKFRIETYVPLAALNGTTGAIIEHGNIINFNDGHPEDHHIIIHVKNTKEYRLLPEVDAQDEMEKYFLKLLKRYFTDEIKEIDYAILAVKPKSPQKGDFSPRTFMYAVQGDGEAGIISLYIQTDETKNPPGLARPSFKIHNEQCSPVPAGYAASIILSNDLVTKSILMKQLTDAGFTVHINPAEKGISATLGCTGAAIFDDIQKGNGKLYGFNLSLQDHPLTLTIVDGKIKLSWQVDTSITYERTEYTETRVGIFPHTTKDVSKVKLSLTKEAPVAAGDGGIQFAIKVSATDLQQSADGLFAQIFPMMRLIKFPDISIDVKADFSQTSNLLLPAPKIIKVDNASGILSPHDLLFAGQIADPDSQ